MPVTSSGAITLQNVQDEFGGSHPISISEYYGSDTVPTSGAISLNNFYGTQSAFSFNLTSSISANGTNLSTLATAAGWDGSVPVIMTIDSGRYIKGSSSSTHSLLVDVAGSTVINNGAIFGDGGSNNGGNGGTAISISVTGTTIQNNSGAFIAGGGGGGGGRGGGGGAGQSLYNTPSSNASTQGAIYIGGGSTVNVSYGYCSVTGTVQGGSGGNQGGGGVPNGGTHIGGCCTVVATSNTVDGNGNRATYNQGLCSSGTVANNPALGGSVLSASSNNDGAGSNGGGGWGRSGKDNGGAAGYAINTGQSYTLTNSGTIYGST